MSNNGAFDEAEFVGPDTASWYRTQIPDWIALDPRLGHTAYRLFVVVRSLILEKQPTKVRLLTHDQLAFLLVGKNGKPTSIDVIKDTLRNLHEVGLMSNPDGERLVRSTGKGGIQVRRRFQLHDWPSEGETYQGWRNAFDKLDAYTIDWRTTRTDIAPAQIDSGKNPSRTEQQEPDDTPPPETPDASPRLPAQTEEDAGHFKGGKKPDDGGKKPGRGGKKLATGHVASEDVTSLKEFPEGVSSSLGSGPEEQEEEGSLPREDDDGAATAVGVLDRALAGWPQGHRRPVAAERARLVERVAAELSSGAEEEDVVYHLSRDLEPGRVSTTAVQVVMGRTKTPGWGKDPRPAPRVPHSTSGGRAVKCSLHPNNTVPCVPCRGDYRAGQREGLRAVLAEHGPQVRPDLAALLAEDTCTA